MKNSQAQLQSPVLINFGAFQIQTEIKRKQPMRPEQLIFRIGLFVIRMCIISHALRYSKRKLKTLIRFE